MGNDEMVQILMVILAGDQMHLMYYLFLSFYSGKCFIFPLIIPLCFFMGLSPLLLELIFFLIHHININIKDIKY